MIAQGDVRKKAPQAGPAPKIQIGKAETFQLANGLKVIVVENHKLPQVSFRIFADYDPVLEKEAAGYIDMMGELMSKGTTKRSKSQIDAEVDFIGASLGTDANGVSAASLTKHSDKILDLMSDVLLHPVFPEEEFQKSIKRTESGLASEKDDAGAISRKVGARLRYGKMHPYGEFTTEASLKKISLEQIKQHYATYLKPNISYLVITGDITRAKAEMLANKYFGSWEKGDVPKNTYVSTPAPEKTVVDIVHKPGAVQSVINITYPVDFKPGTDEAIKARLMNTVLGGYFNSRVNANLREGHGWTYGANTNLRSDKWIGSFSAGASVRNAVTDSSVIEFMKEINLMRTKKVENEELQVVKNVLTGQFSRNLEEPGTVAEFALNIARYNLPADYYETYLTKLNNTTSDEILALARKFLQPDHAHIFVVGNRDDIADRLKQFAPEGKINFWDTNGEPVKAINTNIPAGTDGPQVIKDYLNAIGGTEKVAAVKEMETTVSMEMHGMKVAIRQVAKEGNKLLQDMTMNGQSMGKTIYNNGKAVQIGQGATRPIEGAQLYELKEQAHPIKELNYLTEGYTLVLKGIDEINGKPAYLVEVTQPGGSKTTEFYDVMTSLKVREVSMSSDPNGEEPPVTQEFDDYKPVNGVKFPHSTTTSGMFPMPVKAVVSEIKVNSGVSDALFEIK